MRILAFLFLLHLPCHAIGFANGVKVGEVPHSSTVLWTRLTEKTEPLTWKPGPASTIR